MAKTNPAPIDPKNPATKPQGTTADQISTMESEGQAQGPAPSGASPAHGRGVRQPAQPADDGTPAAPEAAAAPAKRRS